MAKQALRSVTPSPGCGAGHNLGGEDGLFGFWGLSTNLLGERLLPMIIRGTEC